MVTEENNLLDFFESHCRFDGDKTCLTYLADGETEDRVLSYRELRQHSRQFAKLLRRKGIDEESRVVIGLKNNVSYTIAFLGCFYGGYIPVPVKPASNGASLRKLQGIIDDCQPAVIVADMSAANQDVIKADAPSLKPLFLDGTELEGCLLENYPDIRLDYAHERNRIAFLQYTSGSTGNPKGVCVTHGNLLANEGMITRTWKISRDTVYVTWLPLFHDMGLIGVLLQVLYIGGHCVMMPSTAFAMRPIRWLKAIEKYRADISGGPNFAYKWLCSDRVLKNIETLDLSSLVTIYCGSEPISMQTAEDFRSAYRQYGLSSSAFFPCYGMAEATLCVTGGPISREPVYQQVDIFSGKCLTSDAAVKEDRPIRTVVSCGAPIEQDVRIVNPATFEEVAEGETGEVWVNGPNIAPGYWGREDINEEVFGAQVVGNPGKKYLRTGDLAFVKSGEVFVNGRIKELIICNGQNYYPQDIEQSASNSHEATEGMPAAAFLENDMETDALVIVQEIDRKHNRSISEKFVEEVKRKMITSVYRDYALPIKDVFLVRKNTIPRTTSGKICRLSCRKMLANEELSVEC